jgi:hypothetical protein
MCLKHKKNNLDATLRDDKRNIYVEIKMLLLKVIYKYQAGQQMRIIDAKISNITIIIVT